MTDQADLEPPARRRRVVAVLSVVVVAAGAVVFAAVAGRDGHPAAAPSSSAVAGSSPAPTLPDGLASLLADTHSVQEIVTSALHHVVPDAQFDGDDIASWVVVDANVRLDGQVKVAGRVGILHVLASRDPGPQTDCVGYHPDKCRMATGPHGEQVQVLTLEFRNRNAPANQPREFEYSAAVQLGPSRVEARVDNVAIPYDVSNEGQVVPHTGQAPPLTAEQLVAMVLDPTLDMCREVENGNCKPA